MSVHRCLEQSIDEILHDILGEYATVYWNNPKGVPWGEKFPKYPWWLGSVAEAIFLIGAERNSALQKVIGSTYVS